MKRQLLLASFVLALALPGISLAGSIHNHGEAYNDKVEAALSTPMSTAATRPALSINVNGAVNNPAVKFAADTFTTTVVNGQVYHMVGWLSPLAGVTCRQAKSIIQFPRELDYIYTLVPNPLDPLTDDGTVFYGETAADGPTITLQATRTFYCYADGINVQSSQPGRVLGVVVDGVDLTHHLFDGPKKVRFEESSKTYFLRFRPGHMCYRNDSAANGLRLHLGSGGGEEGPSLELPIAGNVLATASGNKLVINTVGGVPGGFTCSGPGNVAVRLNAVEAPDQSPISTATISWQEATCTPGEDNSFRCWIGYIQDGWVAFQKRLVAQQKAAALQAKSGTTPATGPHYDFIRFNGALRQRLQELLPPGTVLPEDVKVVGVTSFVNLASCPTIDFQVTRLPTTNIVNLGRGAVCDYFGKRWNIYFDDVNITSQLDGYNPLSLEGRLVYLNYIPRYARLFSNSSDASIAAAASPWDLVLPYGAEASKAWYVIQAGNSVFIYTLEYAREQGLTQ